MYRVGELKNYFLILKNMGANMDVAGKYDGKDIQVVTYFENGTQPPIARASAFVANGGMSSPEIVDPQEGTVLTGLERFAKRFPDQVPATMRKGVRASIAQRCFPSQDIVS